MIPSIEQIELAIMNHPAFNFRQNLMVFRVTGVSSVVNHECDCLIMTKSGEWNHDDPTFNKVKFLKLKK